MDNPELPTAKLLACAAIVASEGLTGEAAAKRLVALLNGEPDGDDYWTRRARNSKRQHDAYVDWLKHGDD